MLSSKDDWPTSEDCFEDSRKMSLDVATTLYEIGSATRGP